MDRRDFLKTTGAAAVAAGTVKRSACGSSWPSSDETPVWSVIVAIPMP